MVGGLHLSGAAMEARMERTVADLRALAPTVVLAGHCTGWRAKGLLAAAFEGGFQPCVVGGTYEFTAPAPT